ncbi:tetratricopeptide repeat protein [Planctomycetota bacterium]
MRVNDGAHMEKKRRTRSRVRRVSPQQRGNGSRASVVAVNQEAWPAVFIATGAAFEHGHFEEVRDLLNEHTEQDLARLLEKQPCQWEAALTMGLMLFRADDLRRAVFWLSYVLEHVDHPAALDTLAIVYQRLGREAEATDLRYRRLCQQPSARCQWIDYGVALMREGMVTWGLDWLQRACDADPEDLVTRAMCLYHSHYLPGMTPKILGDGYRNWGRCQHPPSWARNDHERQRDPIRRLRVGYISGDFRTQSMADTFESWVVFHDPAQVELFAYDNSPRADHVTERLFRAFHHVRSIQNQDDVTVARLIEADRIDILVTLGGHVDYARLGVLALKPAPIQVDFGGINTSGLSQIDYRITDCWQDPPEAQPYYVERFEYLPSGYICYRPPDILPPVGPLPVRTNGYPTFGCFNDVKKINPQVLHLWGRIFSALPQARLVLKCAAACQQRVRRRLLAALEREGVERSRVDILGWQPPGEHLKCFHAVDIHLDTFPFNGAITTLEGLWMGVPTVSLVGDLCVSRAGLTIFHHAGLSGCLAYHLDEYVTRAVALARNVDALERIRAGLRARVVASSLHDGVTQAREMETAFRRMWYTWCDTQWPSPSAVTSEDVVFAFGRSACLQWCISRNIILPAWQQALQAAEKSDWDGVMSRLTRTRVQSLWAQPRETPGCVPNLMIAGILYARLEQFTEARLCYQEVACYQASPMVYLELANTWLQEGRPSEALPWLRRALEEVPESPELRVLLGECLSQVGRNEEEAAALLRSVAAGCKDSVCQSKALWHLHQTPGWTRDEMAEYHRDWALRHAPMLSDTAPFENSPDPNRRLRIGYLSSDYCSHAVAYFFEALQSAHDSEEVETYGYGQVLYPDPVTDRIRDRFNHYRSIVGCSDAEVVSRIRADGIDILVDLTGHTSDNRLLVLAQKPAPVQVSYLGYLDTTGMPQVDYRFTDRWADLPDAQTYYNETLVPLDSGFICYQPPDFAPPVGPLPVLTGRPFTFGSFNNNAKINPGMLSLWARILQDVSDSVLYLKFKAAEDPEVRKTYWDIFQQYGIDSERIQFHGRLPVVEHLALYNQVDMALDTFPYHGTTTTCEALWMGVPTVCLIGQHHASRVGSSLLERAGLGIFTTQSTEEYVAKAVSFSREHEQLARIRRHSRDLMQHYGLCDAQAYARAVEQAYRRMWVTWCARFREGARCV